jgi:YfiR/HmsC-like
MPFLPKFGFLLGLLATAHAADPKPDEYQVKAAFLCNFANFIEWPSTAYKSADDTFTICVLGRNPFGHTLENIARGKAVAGHSLAVRQIGDVREANGCQILFISSSERLRLRSILGSLKNSSVMPVGDTDNFVVEGGVVGLRLQDGKVRIEIDANAAKERNLRVNPHLLELAKGSR